MIHDIDILQTLFGGAMPSDIHATGSGDICSALLKYNDTPVSISASRKSAKKIRSIYIEQEEFTIEGDFMSQEITIYRKPGQYNIESDRYVQENIIEKVMVSKIEPLRLELSTFIDCVKYGSGFQVTPEQAIHNLEICEHIQRAKL
jgi:predicted dehydrogenase